MTINDTTDSLCERSNFSVTNFSGGQSLRMIVKRSHYYSRLSHFSDIIIISLAAIN